MEFFSAEDIARTFDESRLFGQNESTPASLPVPAEPETRCNDADEQENVSGDAEADQSWIERAKSLPPPAPSDTAHRVGETASRANEL